MDLNWEKFVKRYVWNDERTPYLTRVANLTRVQAHYELFGYSLLMSVLFGVLSVMTLSGKLPHGGAAIVPVYAFTVCCAAVILGFTRHPWAALWCAGAPLAVLAYFGYLGVPSQPRGRRQGTDGRGGRCLAAVLAPGGGGGASLAASHRARLSARWVPRRRARAFRVHAWVFAAGACALSAANWFTGPPWWSFWPLARVERCAWRCITWCRRRAR